MPMIEGRTTRIKAEHYRYNPRKITSRQRTELGTALDELGDLSGVVLNRRTNQLVGGNQRSDIFDLNECEIILVLVNDEPDRQGTISIGFIKWKDALYNYREVDWDEATEAKANIVANKLGGDWDHAVLQEHFDAKDLLQWGFNKSELKWINKLEAFEGNEDDQVPKPARELHTKLGDIYTLNEHRLICGDSTKPETYEKLFRKLLADSVVTDPPYNVAYNKGKVDRMTIANDDMPDANFQDFLFDFYSQATDHLRPGGSWYIFHADSNGHHFRNEFLETGNYLAQCLIWVKDQAVMGRNDYHWQHEPVLYGFKPDPEHVARMIELLQQHDPEGNLQLYHCEHQPILYGWRKGAAHQWNSDRSQKTVLNFPRPRHNDLHPTMKPVGMLEYLISNSTTPGQLVADPFLGSGSTMIAADKQERICYGIELTPGHCDDIVRRWVLHRQEKDLPFKVKRNNRLITKEKWLYE